MLAIKALNRLLDQLLQNMMNSHTIIPMANCHFSTSTNWLCVVIAEKKKYGLLCNRSGGMKLPKEISIPLLLSVAHVGKKTRSGRLPPERSI